MTRISQTFATLKQQNKKALIPYIMAGDPNPSVTVDLMHELVSAGADIIEIGLPFSDPMADGQVISLAGERALNAGTSTKKAVQMVGEFRKTNTTTPVLLMGYLNPVEIIGYDDFLTLCAQNGVDGLLLVDLPPNETDDTLSKKLADKHINQIFLLAPTTQTDRRQAVLKHGTGFIYYVSVKGVTGSKALDTDEVGRQVQAIKADTDLPVCVGFGIKDGESAKAVAKFADGVIVGSELVRHFADVGDDKDKLELAIDKVLSKMDELRQAIDGL
ncbi:tryptophan synthase subunit alpha [Moraxella bovis]|uniref:tryptophan synthase subunit alpha n=1 Tax=Moraxella bovis TaxID=476 RepID=UPI002226C0AB|nr:tryptophan synthase subunit alpha [Moraxella bovis]UYZ69007.1 tryptophan synthase subunit alpha [Moraxella bovis]UYZ71381.1 tryptophan synthase subunit alpha [Moraxella bovis]UYZ72706.1 tryptophan synthase subunit alpha [Moraxella bovis]UZA14674.1 tryptophan synthase subunit alpha [Moraxella bovis]UZA26963.1 tryptophan synthase subunit alpha [Moraxella bovis]